MGPHTQTIQSLGENTVHVCLLVRSGNDFTSGTGTTKFGVRKAHHITDRPITAQSADRMGPLLERLDGSWVTGPGSAALWNAVKLFDASSNEYLARMWDNKKQTRGANPDGCAALHVRHTGEGLYTALWRPDLTTENANRS